MVVTLFPGKKNVRDEASRLEKCLKERGKDNQSAIISVHKRKS